MNQRVAFLIIGIIALSVFGSSLLTILLAPGNIWWTPDTMKLSLDETKDSFSIYVNDERLDDILNRSEIYLKKDDQMVEIEKNDFRFRVNNWHKVKASKMGMVAVTSALTFGGLISLLCGAIHTCPK